MADGFCAACTAAVAERSTVRCLSCPPAVDLDELIGRLEPGRAVPASGLEVYLRRGLGREIGAAVDDGRLRVVSETPDGPTLVARR